MLRPTFHESWHRVAGLRPRLRASVHVSRQQFRGRRWHVLEDPASGRYFRLDDAGYEFVGRLDGTSTVTDAWRASMQKLGDDGLTQGDVVGLLGQLWQADLLWAEAAGDTRAMFARGRERRARELRGYLASLLFLRIPLFDPDALLNRWSPLVAWLVGPIGAVLWLVLVLVGAWHLVGRSDELLRDTSSVLAGANLLPLALTFVLIKALHELGHAVTCKVYGQQSGRGGEVHTIGVMLLIFMPVPYVDATSSWGLRSRFQQIVVAAAGMIVELACAAIAAVVWARTGEGTLVNAIASNVILLAGVSTLVFNGNPLLRFDGYYILSDLIGVPNLAHRSQEYLRHLVKRHVYGVRESESPAQDAAEARWLFGYGVASSLYRVVVYVGIALFIASQQFLVGGAILLFVVIAWVIAPILKLLHYLAQSPELERTRRRAALSTAGFAGVVLAPLGLAPAPDSARIEGIAEPRAYEVITARTDGFIRAGAQTGINVRPGEGTTLLELENAELGRRGEVLDAELERLRVSRALAFRDDPARAVQIDGQIAVAQEQRRRVSEQVGLLRVEPAIAGQWIAPGLDAMVGSFAPRGTAIGLVADMSELRVRAVLDQRRAAIVIEEGGAEVDVRPRMRPDQQMLARLERVLPGGQRSLPAASLGVVGGGATPTSAEDQRGLRTTEDVFEAWIALPADHGLLLGQRVEVRIALRQRPLAVQWFRSLRQVLQERFSF